MKEALIKFIEKELSYDATISLHCPKCKYEEKSYWIDHRDALAANIATELHLKDTEKIKDILEDVNCETEGDRKKDAKNIVERIGNELIEFDYQD